jgi:hypothetical protein
MSNCGSTYLGNCSIDLTGIGQVGATGAQGEYGGYSSVWNFSTTTTSGTTAGQLRFNSGTYASVTTMYINKTNQDSTDLSNFLATLSNGTYYGKIRIFKESDSSKFWEGTITNVSAGASEYTLTVSYILANSTFSASDSVVLSFTPHGIGAKPLLYSTYGGYFISTAGSWVVPDPACEFTIPAGLLATNGDYVEVFIRGNIGGSGSFMYDGVRCTINTDAIVNPDTGYTVITGEEIAHASSSNGTSFELRVYIERYDDTTAITSFTYIGNSETPLVNSSITPTVNSFTNSTNDFAVELYNSDTSEHNSITSIKAIKYLQ